MHTNITSREALKEIIKKGMQDKFKAAYLDQQFKNQGAGSLYSIRKQAE